MHPGKLRSTFVASFMLFFTCPAMSHAEESQKPLVITIRGGLMPIGVSEYGRAYSVVQSSELKRRQIVYASDVLRALPGVAVSQTGTAGGLTQIRIRGAEGNHTLVLIDGVEVASTEGGEYDFGGLLADDIERIEVLRGPQSSLFGSNAVGGVISITTRRARTPGLSGNASVEAGNDGTLAGSAAAGVKTQRGDMRVSLARRHTGGYDQSDSGGDVDHDDNLTMNLVGNYSLARDVEAGGTLRYTDHTNDYDQFNFGAPTEQDLVTDAPLQHTRKELFGSAFVTADALDRRLESELRFTFANMDDWNYDDGAKTADTTGTRRTARLKLGYALDGHSVAASHRTVTGAVEWKKETFQANDPALVYDPSQLEVQSRNLLSGVLEYRHSFDMGLDLQLGLRHDDNDGFENANTYSLGLSYPIPRSGTRLHASSGTGVKNPTLYEQFGFIPDQFQGNPDLKPEQSRGWDVGIEQTFLGGSSRLDVTYFDDHLTDKITTDYSTYPYTPINMPGTSKRKGVEVTGHLQATDALGFDLDYTYLDARDPDGNREVRRPKHEVALNVSYDMWGGRTRLTGDVRHIAGNEDYDFTAPSYGTRRIKLDDYSVVNLAVSQRIRDHLEVYARVDNALDAEYMEIQGYVAQGRTFYAGMRANF